MQNQMNKHTYPNKILPTVRSDMMAYHRHGYSFDDYCDRNTHGRNYGKELYDIWLETLEEYKKQEDEKHAGVSENHGHEGRSKGKNRRGKQQ